MACNKGNAPGRCLKHHPSWRGRIQWLMNSLRDAIIPVKYLGRFNHLLCTCDESANEIDNPWETVTDEMFAESVTFIDGHINQNPDNPHNQCLRKLMTWLRQDKEINPELTVGAQPVPRSSALRMLYLLQRTIGRDFSVYISRRQSMQAPRVPKRVQMTLTVELEGIREDMIGHIIGWRGDNLMPLQRRLQCGITLESRKIGEVQKVYAKIVKRAEQMSELEEVREELQQLANETQGQQENYTGGGNMDFSDDDSYGSVGSNMEESGDQPAGIGSLNLNPPAANENAASTSSANQSAEPGGDAQPSGSGSANQNGSLDAATDQSSGLNIATNQATGSEASERPSVCLVHDRRWSATFQFMLTRCYNQIQLTRKDGRPFWKFICVCEEKHPDVRLYYPNNTVDLAMEKFRHDLSEWPRETHLVIQPIINQIDKKENADVWCSLFKFSFAYEAVSAKMTHRLDQDYKLPGTDYVYRLENQSAAGGTQSGGLSQMINGGASSPGASASSSGTGLSATAGASGIGAGSSVGVSRFVPMETSASSSATSQSGNSPKKLKSLKRVSPEEWDSDCFFHGPKKKSRFQCIVNYLHSQSRLSTALNIPFSHAVCLCKEEVDQQDFYPDEAALRGDCIFMRDKLKVVRGDNRATFVPFVKLLDDYIENQQITNGFMKLVYHFNQVFKGNLQYYNELQDLAKKQQFQN
ncbi:uncharacterized protein LOC128244924 isoform X2 [Mya arenaria]|uniref:uncharacterized protein LOC128244924 isoform X2 n=1 Tax=Mya arenaria TaxID=6604 RepID=UPI0022E5F4F7|nr:uncharacterized protein LOC128244924 isoform X2 [Mya arenaria]